MTRTQILSSVAALALLATPAASLAAYRGGGHVGGGAHFSGGGAPATGARMGGAPSASFAAAGPRYTGAAPTTGPGPRFTGAPAATAPAAGTAGQTAWNNRGAWGSRNWRHPGSAFWPGVAAGAAVGALGSYAYYGGPDYYDYGPGYDDTYYDTGYYDGDATVAVVPGTIGTGADASYCAQRFRSYDPATGTYLGYDGQRHPCP